MKYGYSSTIITSEGESKPLKAGFPADNANNAGMIPAAAGAFVHTKKSRVALLVGVFLGALLMGALTNTNKSTARMKSKESKEETLFMVASDKSELSVSGGELTWWNQADAPLNLASCEYAQPNSISGGNTPWLAPYVNQKKDCAVSEDLFQGGAACGKCFLISYSGNQDIIQVVNNGAGGQRHFDCDTSAFSKITGGATTGIFQPVSYEEVDCEDSPLSVVVLPPEGNLWYTKVLLAGGKTAVQAATLTLDGSEHPMSRVSGATWKADPNGLKGNQVQVRFDVTYDDGSKKSVHGCFDGKWPAGVGTSCISA